MTSMMGGMKGKGANTGQKVFTGIQIQTSAAGIPIAICLGQNKLSDDLLWANDFRKYKVNNGGKGGKGLGGGGKKGGATYDYKVAGIMGLCEGQIQGIGQVWANGQLTTLDKLNLSLKPGSASQSIWSYLEDNHPDQALAYAYTAYVYSDSYDLGEAASLPNHEFEVIGKLVGTMPGTVDINFADALHELFSNPQYGIGAVSLDSDSLSLYKSYCQAQGLFFSPLLNDANTTLADVINNWAQLSNSFIFWSGDSIKFVPLGDISLSANGATYTPDLTPVYDLTSDDFLSDDGAPPVEIDQADPSDLPNHVKMEVLDRSNAYVVSPVEWQDQALVDEFGRVDANVQSAHEICDLKVANTVKMLIGQRGAYIRNSYAFKLGYEFSLLEPGDIVTLYDPPSGITSPITVRITDMDEDENDEWDVKAEDFILGVGSVSATSENGSDGYKVDTDVDPGNCLFPALLEPTADFTQGKAQLWLSLSGGEDWGGAYVFISFDTAVPPVNFSCIGLITAPAYQGVLRSNFPAHNDPDTTNTLQLDLSASVSEMQTIATHDDADNHRTIALLTLNTPGLPHVISNVGEVIAYGGVTQSGTGPYNFDLTYHRRALMNTTPTNFPAGSRFARFDIASANSFPNSCLIYDIPTQYIFPTPKPISFKFVSYNKFGPEKGVQDIADVDYYVYTPTGAGYGTGPIIRGKRTVTVDGATVTSPVAMLPSDSLLIVKNTSGADVVVLAPAGPTNGQEIQVKYKSRTGAGNIILKDSTNTIELDRVVTPPGKTVPLVWSSSDASWE